jgi:hypothetical protein
MLKLKCPVLILNDGTELSIDGEFLKPSDIAKAMVKAVFNHHVALGVATTRAYQKAADDCGYDSPSTVYRIIAG